jgi:hypothetical protein
MNDSLKMKNLISNMEVHRILQYFEDAKMMHKAEYLDEGYFYNFFITTVRRLTETKNPTFIEYIDKKRNYNTDSVNVFLWDGFDFCLFNIFIPQTEKEGDTTTLNRLIQYWDDNFEKYDARRDSIHKTPVKITKIQKKYKN